MNEFERKLIKMLTTDTSEVQNAIIEEFSDVFANAFYFEGSIDKTNLLNEKQVASCSDDTYYNGVLSNSNLPQLTSEIWKKAVKKARNMK